MEGRATPAAAKVAVDAIAATARIPVKVRARAFQRRSLSSLWIRPFAMNENFEKMDDTDSLKFSSIATPSWRQAFCVCVSLFCDVLLRKIS